MSIRYALLCLLEQDGSTASGLHQRFTHTMQGLWPLNIGQVAQTLTRLERDGLVHAAGTRIGSTGRRATVYKLTDAGRRSLGQWWASPIELPIGEREEIITKVVFASERGTLLEILDVQRGGLLRQIRSLNKRASHLPFAATAERLIVEKHIYDLEAQARWLDRVEALYSAGGKDAP